MQEVEHRGQICKSPTTYHRNQDQKESDQQPRKYSVDTNVDYDVL
jgi:hypothetical protein